MINNLTAEEIRAAIEKQSAWIPREEMAQTVAYIITKGYSPATLREIAKNGWSNLPEALMEIEEKIRAAGLDKEITVQEVTDSIVLEARSTTLLQFFKSFIEMGIEFQTNNLGLYEFPLYKDPVWSITISFDPDTAGDTYKDVVITKDRLLDHYSLYSRFPGDVYWSDALREVPSMAKTVMSDMSSVVGDVIDSFEKALIRMQSILMARKGFAEAIEALDIIYDAYGAVQGYIPEETKKHFDTLYRALGKPSKEILVDDMPEKSKEYLDLFYQEAGESTREILEGRRRLKL